MGWGGRLFEAGRLLTFSAFRMGAYSRLGAYSNKYGILVVLDVMVVNKTALSSKSTKMFLRYL